MDKETFTIKLIDLKDTENEKEGEKNEEEMDKKIRLSLLKGKLFLTKPADDSQHWKSFQSLHHPDILTPPPELA